MCRRITQIRARIEYVQALGVAFDHRQWVGGDIIRQYNLAPGATILVLDRLDGSEVNDHRLTWGYQSPAGFSRSGVPVDKMATAAYFRHMLGPGRVLIPADGWYEWSGEPADRRPWYARSKIDEPIFLAGLTNYRPGVRQAVQVGAVIVTVQGGAGVVDANGRRPVVFSAEDGVAWLEPALSPGAAELLAMAAARPLDEFEWYPVGPAVDEQRPMSELSVAEAYDLIAPLRAR